MPVSDGYLKGTLSKLNAARPIDWRKMFGGVGLYSEGVFFAVMDDDRLFFKVDDSNRAEYEKAGMEQWTLDQGGAQKMPYFEVPGAVLSNPGELEAWIDAAVQVALRKKAKKGKGK